MCGNEARHNEALRRLPRVHAHALRMRDTGLPDALIANSLDVEPEALRPLFEIAEAKLAAICEALARKSE